MARASQVLNKVLNEDFTGLVVAGYDDNNSALGNGYFYNDIIDINGKTTLSFVIDTTQVEEDKSILILPIIIKSQSEVVKLNFYEGTDYVGNTPMTNIYNINRSSTKAHSLDIKTGNVNGTTKGILLKQHIAFSKSQGSFITSDTLNSKISLILKRNTKYLLEIENTGNSSTLIEVSEVFYEI